MDLLPLRRAALRATARAVLTVCVMIGAGAWAAPAALAAPRELSAGLIRALNGAMRQAGRYSGAGR